VLVTADHGWRAADLYDGRVDHRVPFLLKAPGASRAVVVGTPLDTVVTGDLLLAILRGEIVDTERAGRWMDAHRIAPPSRYGRTGRPHD
jgi:hypothetical protein